MKNITSVAFMACFACALMTFHSFAQQDKEPIVLMKTNMGDISLKLYNETPQHRDNFLKLVNESFYDSVLFHRVIKQFMIQGGDPTSKNAPAGQLLGNGENGYTIPAEFVPTLYHKKGALAAARQGDAVNPTKSSSGCQFYIVQGKVFSEIELDAFEVQKNQPIKQKLFGEYINRPENKELKERFVSCQMNKQMDSLMAISALIEPELNKMLDTIPHFSFTEEQRKLYTTIGGTPHLDGAYTVYGEVVSGMEVVDKIAEVSVDGNNRPTNNVIIYNMEVVNANKAESKKEDEIEKSKEKVKEDKKKSKRGRKNK